MTRCGWMWALGALALAACHRDDATITAKAQANVNNAVQNTTANVEVQVDDGVVTLSGTVPTGVTKQRAEEAAKKTEGVKGIRDELVVGGGGSSVPPATPAENQQ